MKRFVVAASIVAVLVAGAALAQDKKPDRETKVRDDKARVEADAKWIYDDLPRGIEEAKKSGKPLLVVFRCIPCEACAKLDEDVVARDPIVAKLLDQFVCVRIPHANGMDLSLFQFDYDQSWAAFVLKPDLTIIARYGTRSSQKDSTDDVSLEGFAKTLQAALDLQFEKSRSFLAKKSFSEVKRPEDYPSLKGHYAATLDWQGKVVPSCMHCHMVEQAQRLVFRSAGEPIPVETLFPYPNPKSIGLVMDPREKAHVKSVAAGSLAEKQGFRAGDDIVTMANAPVLSIADVQWVLNSVHDDTKNWLRAGVIRDGKPMDVEMRFPPGWRRADDISWRASSWDLRRMTTGGMKLDALTAEERAKLSIADGAMALVAKYVPQNGEHAAAKNAGFQKGDVVVSVDGRTDVMTETQWLTWLVNAKKPGEKIAVVVLRDGKKLELTLPMQ